MKGLKYFSDYFSNYEYAALLQTAMLLLFIAFFASILYLVYNRPKSFYDEVQNLPLEKDENLTTQKE